MRHKAEGDINSNEINRNAAESVVIEKSQIISLHIKNERLYVAATPTTTQGWASVLFKRTFRSLRSFAFFLKECSVLCVLLRSL